LLLPTELILIDPALLRSGRLDRKIEFPAPMEEARARIMQIHARKMKVDPDMNYEELARSSDDFNGALVSDRRGAVPGQGEGLHGEYGLRQDQRSCGRTTTSISSARPGLTRMFLND
tara:strand:+ start:1091 stop:1441 length:351 start_codon:yes stop_codon:yes gene_type:complete